MTEDQHDPSLRCADQTCTQCKLDLERRRYIYDLSADRLFGYGINPKAILGARP